MKSHTEIIQIIVTKMKKQLFPNFQLNAKRYAHNILLRMQKIDEVRALTNKEKMPKSECFNLAFNEMRKEFPVLFENTPDWKKEIKQQLKKIQVAESELTTSSAEKNLEQQEKKVAGVENSLPTADHDLSLESDERLIEKEKKDRDAREGKDQLEFKGFLK